MTKLIFALLCLHFVASVYCKDATLIIGSGEDVVDAVIDKIQSSCIFSNDKYFMKRIAAVNTNYGKDMKNNDGGIWKVQQSMIGVVKSNCGSNLRSYCNNVLKFFNVDYNLMTMNDMEIPLNSALMMRAYIRVYTSDIPASISAQAVKWNQWISKQSSNEFLNKANISPNCFSPKIDLIFAIDASGSVGSINFNKTRTFIKDVVADLKIGPDSVRVAVIRYASGATVSFHLNAYNDLTSLKQKIDSIRYTSGGTNTAAAINLASTTFISDRPNVLKILVLITDGRSNNFQATVTAANKLKTESVTIFTIGVGHVRDLEMLRVASDPSCTHFFKLSSYGEIDSIIHQIQRKACESLLEVENNGTETKLSYNQLAPENKTQSQRFVVDSNSSPNDTTTTTIKVDIVCGVVHAYASTTHKNPNSAVFEIQSTAISGVPAWLHSDSRYKLYVNLIAKRSADVNDPGCTNPHYNISINPENTDIAVICTENGIVRPCKPSDIKESFKDLFDNTKQCHSVVSTPNPCTMENILNNKMRFPHPEYRNMYIQCKITGGREIVICPTGTYYNEQQSMCNPYVAPPSNGSQLYTGPNPCTRQALAKRQFYFTNPSNNATFIQCDEQGIAFLVPCAANTIWSQKAYTCIHKSLALYNPCGSLNVTYYPNPSSNTSFIRCDSNDVAFLMPCAPSTVWSQTKQTCIIDSTPASSSCNPNSCISGEYCPFPGDTNAYYLCSNGQLIKLNCPPGLVWNQKIITCSYP